MTKKYRLDVSSSRFHFIVIGCGGNGSFLIRDLARLIAIKNQDLLEAYEKKLVDFQAGRIRRPSQPLLHTLTIADGDTIEAKNIRRQNFVMGDVGLNKAEVLQERYSIAYGLEIGCCNTYISSPEHLEAIATTTAPSPYGLVVPFFIGCVDNNATRSLIAQTMINLNHHSIRAFWLDGGNEEFSGQIVLGNNDTMTLKQLDKRSLEIASSRPSMFNMPVVTQVYPEILDVTDKRPDQMSCDDRAVSFPQCIATNITMATLMLDFCNHFINMPTELETWMINFDVKKINFGTTFNTLEDHSRVSDNPVWKAPTLQVTSAS